MKNYCFLGTCLWIVSTVYAVEVIERREADESAVIQSETSIWVPVTLEVKPIQGDAFVFGELNDVAFILKNVSNWRVVVAQISPAINLGEGNISLWGSVYGSVEKDPQKDAYIYNRMSQCQTRESFYDGFLLPGEGMTVHHSYRPIAKKEQFKVSYFILDDQNSSSKEQNSLMVYMPALDDMPGRVMYTPFEEGKWKTLNQTNKPIRKTGVNCSYRGVLIPDLHNFRNIVLSDPNKTGLSRSVQSYTKIIPIPYDNATFCLEDAYEKINSIRQNEHGYEAVYCQTLGGYVVLDGQQGKYCWVLKNADQTEKGELLAGFDAALAKEIDSRGSISVNVGEKQEGFGSDVKAAGWEFWDVYPVSYGDGMYTRGEFIRIKKEQLADFLKTTYQKGFRLRRRPYYFDSAYYVLETTK